MTRDPGQTPSKPTPTHRPPKHKPSGGGTAPQHAASSGDLMSLIHKAGFQGSAAQTMYGIVMAESGGNSHALANDSDDLSYGLAQINMIGGLGPARLRQYGLSSNDDLYDPLTNLRVAYQLSNGGTNFTPWTTYTTGAYQQYAGQSGAKITSHGGGGGAGTMSNGETAIPNARLHRSDYASQFGALRGLLTKIPALRNLLAQATAGQWSRDKFVQEIQTSNWWKNHSDTVRQALATKFADPATWDQNLGNERQSIHALAAQLGFELTPDQIENIATNALLTGNTSNQQWLTHAISRRQDFSDVKSGDDLNGQMATAFGQLQELAKSYGINYSAATLAQSARSIVAGNNTLDAYKQHYQTVASSMYPGLTDQLKSGMTVSEIADPYVQTYSRLLEVDPSAVGLTNPLIRQALQGVPTGKSTIPSVMPLTDFEKQVRNDPRWQYTQNAREQTASTLAQVGQDWGFSF